MQFEQPDGTQGYAEFQRQADGSLRIRNARIQSPSGEETPLDPAIVASIVNGGPKGTGGKPEPQAAADSDTDAAAPGDQGQVRASSEAEFLNDPFPSNRYRRLLGMPELYGPVATRSS